MQASNASPLPQAHRRPNKHLEPALRKLTNDTIHPEAQPAFTYLLKAARRTWLPPLSWAALGFQLQESMEGNYLSGPRESFLHFNSRRVPLAKASKGLPFCWMGSTVDGGTARWRDGRCILGLRWRRGYHRGRLGFHRGCSKRLGSVQRLALNGYMAWEAGLLAGPQASLALAPLARPDLAPAQPS